ncbi:DUF1360 domain-containing protein [Bacillus sp. JCM 19034]|uniref:DUF1360 domain-containing protein n=1 Tax=Bacillus sp. JCM 19034 TaxID=1481928 RepID=UPI000784F80D|nr:DUF1360 domain-containing protein [Bacillus sp. JCM 19034]
MVILSWMDLFIIIFATYRLTRLIVFDSITAFIRNPFLEVTYIEDEKGQLFEETKIKGKGFQKWVGELLSCYWCIGIWSAAFVVLLYLFVAQLFVVFLILAVAGVASLLQSKTSE